MFKKLLSKYAVYFWKQYPVAPSDTAVSVVVAADVDDVDDDEATGAGVASSCAPEAAVAAKTCVGTLSSCMKLSSM